MCIGCVVGRGVSLEEASRDEACRVAKLVHAKTDFCLNHPQLRLESFYDGEIDDSFGTGQIYFCPSLDCDFVRPEALGLEPGLLDAKKYHLLLMTAARQKAFFRKFVSHFVGDGK